MSTRAEQKRQSLNKILEVASIRMREAGMDGAAIATIMQEAGLTHGTFYAHFANRDELAREAFKFALEQSQPGWLGNRKETWRLRLKRLASEYLTPKHRDDVGHGCAISALASDFAIADDDFHATFDEALRGTLCRICEHEEGTTSSERYDESIAFLAMCVGGLNLARAVKDPAFSQQILDSCNRFASNINGSNIDEQY